MKLPFRKNALIPRNKLTKYLLSETHLLGKFKAKLFRSLGFNETNVDILEESLLSIAQSNDIKEEISFQYGTKYIIDGKIETPNGKIVKIRTVWIIEEGEKKPRFVTAYRV